MKPSHVLVLVSAIFAAFLPFLGILPGWTAGLATVVYINALSLIGLNLIFGVTGMLALGQAAFMAIPAYAAGILNEMGLPVLLAAVIGFASSLVIAICMGRIFVRLPGIYLAVGTLGFSFVVEGIARAFPSVSGGASGLVLERGRELSDLQWYVIALFALLGGTILYVWLVRGAFWRRLRTIHHDELAAQVLGINVSGRKVEVFVIGAAFAGVAGLLKAYYVGVVIPEDGGVERSLEQLAMVMVGGPGYVLGPLLGSGVMQWLFVVTGYAKDYVLLIYGAVFLAAVLYFHDGIAGGLAVAWRKIESWMDGGPNLVTSDPQSAPIPKIAHADRSGICLIVSNISKNFSGVRALDGVCFNVEFGEIFAIVGPNGAGKSTLFNIVSGIEAASTGTVKLDNHDLSILDISRRAAFVGRSFQVARLVPDLTVVENIMARLDQIAPHLTEAQRRAKALEQIAVFGLADCAFTLAGRLSAGQHKLVDIARAAAGDPPLLLLDEPAVGLTATELNHLGSLLSNLKARGSAIVVVEHDIQFISKVAQRGIVLDGGRRIAIGPVKEILNEAKVRDAYFGALE